MRTTTAVRTSAFAFACWIAVCAAENAVRHRFLAVDTLEGKKGLHYVDEANPTNDWSVAGSWRDIQLIGDNRVALSDPDGVSIVDMKTRRVVGTLRPKRTETVTTFEDEPPAPGEEGGRGLRRAGKQVVRDLKNVLSFRFMPDGLLIFCMTGRGLTITDPLGLTQKDLVVTNANGLVRPTGDAGWTFTVMGGKGDYYATEVAGDGKERARIRIHKSKPVYKTCKLANGNYLVTAGYGGFAAEMKADGDMEKEYTTGNRFFYSGFQVLPNGNMVVANWIGHNEAERRQPTQGDQIIEFTPSGKVAWSYNNLERLGCVHGVIVLDELDTAFPYEQIHGRLVRVPGTGELKVHAGIAAPANSLDGLAVLPDGAVAISVPNLNDRKAEPALLRVAADGTTRPLASLKPAIGSDRVVPFGMDAAPSGELFVADNQFFSGRYPKPGSRLLAVGADGGVREVATGLCVANGVRVQGDYVYVTDSQLPGTGSNAIVSALYRFPLKGETVKLEGDPAKSPNMVTRFETAMVRDPFGADGIVFDTSGLCYVSMFDGGAVVRFRIDAKGKAGPAELVVPQGALASADGMAFHAGTGSIFIADPRANAVHRWHPKEGLRIHARTTTDRSAGRLDMPVDVAVSGDKVLVSNWTSAGCPCAITLLPVK